LTGGATFCHIFIPSNAKISNNFATGIMTHPHKFNACQ